ncbi:hypothetical protein GCM10007886_44970 [Methylobacterium gregans]|nr:hypothetical protein GCM10007886_44970 [Methylobacterium gregans]
MVIDQDEVEGAHLRLDKGRDRVGVSVDRDTGLGRQHLPKPHAAGRAVIDEKRIHGSFLTCRLSDGIALADTRRIARPTSTDTRNPSLNPRSSGGAAPG